ncbi:biotin-dependent carboxyltransferase family protein [Pseudoxanthomonas sp. PXM02]|uniref:5-oxoprolinase subunit C family protein n=1 Tax=Pseudoxanthomonas sp. PXM02 TaxID=2769294 RepID=UPI0017833996|nr:biotin-dependent carboxyltransferase family protein [Pseudoxanthomonas sp. PXM02]MBD9479962.1 biotin-dependent carboxyltransferase family protein [Pseudoxanthomonas sp. PXM02]
MTAWQVLAAGAQTTVQDQGRHGWRHLGVGRAGALDTSALAVANLLVGNDETAAGLEMALQGPRLRLPRACRIALTGAAVPAWWNDVPLPAGRPLDLPAGELRFGTLRDGLRAWLAIAGGIAAPSVLGSRSTDLRGGFGGLEGRALVTGDRLPLGDGTTTPSVRRPTFPSWWVDMDDAWTFDRHVLRYLPSSHAAAESLAAHAWHAHANSNRQGLRLTGASLPAGEANGVSEPVAIGTLQLPPDGQPILLLADAQTVGGYPRLGHVLACDLGRAAQLRPGEPVHFEPVTAQKAQTLVRDHAHRYARVRLAIAQRR